MEAASGTGCAGNRGERYTPLLIGDILDEMIINRDIFLISDTKLYGTTPFAILKKAAIDKRDPTLIHRIVPQIYNCAIYSSAVSASNLWRCRTDDIILWELKLSATLWDCRTFQPPLFTILLPEVRMHYVKSILIRPTRLQFMAVCAAIGALGFFAIYGIRTLDFSNESWIWPAVPEGDAVQNYAGWMAYRHSPWEFPLARTNSICWPDGTIIAYMDANPLLSVFLKLLSPVLPQTFVVFGWFTLICYLLQGIAGGLLAKLYASKVWHAYLVAALFVFSPILMERSFRHIQMAAQFLILYALYFYLLTRRNGYIKFYWQYILLNVIAIGVFPYFLPMVMALLFVAVVEAMLATRKVLKPLLFLLANIAAALAAGYLLGVVGWQGSNYSRGGYGYFSMNLNALFNPSSLGDYQWSWVLGRLPQHSGQYDGFNYLGLGVLLMGFFILVDYLLKLQALPTSFGASLLQSSKRFVRRYRVLLAVCLVLTAFAVSTTVVMNGRTLIDLPLPSALDALFGIFRASSRLFYPVYYLIFLFVARYLMVRFSPRQTSLLIGLLLVIQLADLSGVILQKHRYYAHPPVVETPVSDLVLTDAASRLDSLILLEDIHINHYYTALAAKYGLNTNIRTVNSGHYPMAEAVGRQALDALLKGSVAPDTLYVAEHPDTCRALYDALEGADVQFYEYDGLLFIIPSSAKTAGE